jgi:hypothetical protein
MKIDIGISYPEKLSFKSFEEIYDYVYNIDYNKLKGVIIFAPNNFQYLILNKTYYELYNSRGNEPSIKFRYLQVRMDNDKVDMLKYLYEDKIKDFEEYENYVYDLSQIIYQAYIDRYIKKLYVTLPTEEFNIMKEAHDWYLLDRNNKISYSKIIEILNRQKPTNLNKMIKRLKFKNNDVEKEKKPYVYSHKRLLPTIKKT